MKWWELYDPGKRIPGYVSPASDAATDRAGVGGVLTFIAVACFIVSVVSWLFFGAYTVAWWGFGIAAACLLVGRLLLGPSIPRRQT